jgi:glycosyltransferase involved in cell wall biosynthesis
MNFPKQPLVTIYIPCRNYGKFLSQSIESVVSQLYTNWELFIVDEDSNDDTLLVADKYKLQNPGRISVIKNKTPAGLQKLSNDILNRANGKYMMRLDADDWLDEVAILAMVAKLEEKSDIGIVYGNYFYVDVKGNILDIESRYKLGIEDTAGHLAPHGACTMFRTRSLKSVGGYSETVNAQDGWDLWYKLFARIGAASLNIPTFYYRQHGKSMSCDRKRLLDARSKIFEDISKRLEGDYNSTCLAVIPVRESYKNFKNVPYQEINGCSLLEIAILSAINSDKVSDVVVSSESQNVLDYSKHLEEEGRVPKHLRLKRFKNTEVSRNVPIQDIMIEAGEFFKGLRGVSPDMVIFLNLHAVYRKTEHINTAINILNITESDSVVSVQEERDPMFSHGENGLNLLNPGRFVDLTFDRERLYCFNGSIIATWWEVVRAHGVFGEKIGYIEMSAEDSLQIKTLKMLNYLKASDQNE